MCSAHSEEHQSDLDARNLLVARQGKGARYDAPNAPFDDLLLTRRGAAYFARKLNELNDSDMNGPSRIVGWTRAQLIADISYHARSMAVLLERVRNGLPNERAVLKTDIKLAATLPAQALRHLYTHTNIHLNVEFRDIETENWNGSIICGEGTLISIMSLPLLRAKVIWKGAVDLNSGSRLTDLPNRVLC